MSVPLRDYLIRDLITNEIQCDCFSYEVKFVLESQQKRKKEVCLHMCCVFQKHNTIFSFVFVK